MRRSPTVAMQRPTSIDRDQSFPRSQPSDLMMRAVQRCPREDVTRCQEWFTLVDLLTADLRQLVIGARSTIVRVDQWVEQSLSLLEEESAKGQSLAVEILITLSKRLKFRSFPMKSVLTHRLNIAINQEKDPLISSRLLNVLSELTPLGYGQSFYKYTGEEWSSEVQSAAWRVIASRHSNVEPVKLQRLSQAMVRVKSRGVKSSLILAAVDLKTPRVIRWCGEEWWRTELFESCREALSHLGTERASRSLWKWVKSLFSDMDQALNADQTIAKGLIYLSRATHTSKAEKRYQRLLDRFFARRRAEPAAIAIAESWLELPSKRFALELSLRYLRAKSSKIVTQSHFFEQHLRKIIYQLSTPVTTQKD